MVFRSYLITYVLFFTLMVSCDKNSQNNIKKPGKEQNIEESNSVPDYIKITIAGETLSVKMENNVATRALVKALDKAPISYTASDYGGFEKVGALGFSLPTSNSQITAVAGDVILYNGNQIVLFYGSNSWSYTRIGKIKYNSLEELKSFLKAGEGDVTIKLSL